MRLLQRSIICMGKHLPFFSEYRIVFKNNTAFQKAFALRGRKIMRYGAVIVAAGMSTRMKHFKQMMKIGDLSIAERVVVNFRRAGVEDIVMVTGYNADQLEKALRGFGLIFARNDCYETTEMFDSAKLGLNKLAGKCDRVFFCPVDVPFFTDRTVTDEMSEMDRHPEADVIVPTSSGRDGHPILIKGGVIPTLLAYTGDMGMKGACNSLPEGSIRKITVDDDGAVTDADTEDDFFRLVDIHNSRLLHSVVKLSFATTTSFFGPGTVDLMKEIDRCNSVKEACEKCGFSYSKGWSIIRSCEERFGYRIVERQAGGQTGGAAFVTDKGHDLLAVYEKLDNEISGLAEERFHELMEEYGLTGSKNQ